MNLTLIPLPLFLLLSPLSTEALHIKHSSRLDTGLWRMLNGQRVSSRTPAEERGVDGAFESDMRLTSQQLDDILHQQRHHEQDNKLEIFQHSLSPSPDQQSTGRSNSRKRRLKRKAVARESYLWPGRTVPYLFHPDFPESYRQTVLRAMQFWQYSTCVKFVPFSDSMTEYLRHLDHVLFQEGPGCQSSIGRVGMGEQTTEIASHCNEFGSVAHELGHVLGFYHEQSRPDRDNHVIILRDNIREGRQHNFLKYSANEIITDEPYDIGSVMHYGPTYFSKDGTSLTIDTEDETYRAVMGQRNAPSFIDVKTANEMYSCNDKCGEEKGECQNMGYMGPHCTCMCPTGLGGWDCTELYALVSPELSNHLTKTRLWGVLTSTTGVIESPGYGYGYDDNVDCIWLIQGPIRSTMTTPTSMTMSSTMAVTVTVRMEWFEVEDDSVQPCAFDWLEIRTQGPHLNGQRFCGEGPSEDIVYQGNALVLHFHSDDSYTFGGFRLRYFIQSYSDGVEILDYAAYESEEPNDGLTIWTQWSPCSRLCGGGARTRIRTCTLGYCGDSFSLYEEEKCNEQSCYGSGDEEDYYDNDKK